MDNRPLPNVPNREIVDTSDPDRVAQIVDEFFDSVLKYCGLTEQRSLVFCEILDFACVKNYFSSPEVQRLITDDFLRLLIVRDVTVASVICRRNVFNNVEVTCALYITEKNVERVRLDLFHSPD